jgi:tRNA A37 methylthiotransferase MiaB
MDMQKKIVRERNKAMKGKIYPCLMEMPVDEYGAVWTGRIYSQAPEVDGVVYVTGYEQEKGKLVNVRIKKFKDYDFVGECV